MALVKLGGGWLSGFVGKIPGAPVLVESVLLSARGGRLCFRTVARRLGDGEHPDACARSLAGPGVVLLHSSSWRYSDGEIVLTYVGLPDPDQAAAVEPVLDPPAARGAHPLAPSPPSVHRADVAAHACRHLAFLRHTDAQVAGTVSEAVEVWDLIDAFTPAVAGLLPMRSR